MIVRAKYIGIDSVGYKNGVEYDIKVCKFNLMAIHLNNNVTMDGFKKYSSIQSFLSEWTNIRTISE